MVPAPTPPDYESDPLYQQAQQLQDKDIRKAMGMLEDAIAKAPEDPHSAPYYLLLGRLKKEYTHYPEYDAGSPERTKQNIKEFREYAQARPTEFFHDSPSDEYLYDGFHFKELEKRFPSSALAAEAGYEITNLSQGGECEGLILCYISGAFEPVRKFLTQYPDSPHTAEAAQRADDAFRKTLWGDRWKTDLGEITDPTKATDYYDPAELKKLVEQYEELGEKLPSRFRPRIYETAAYYHARLRETDRARTLYERILSQFPDYENMREVRQKLAALK